MRHLINFPLDAIRVSEYESWEGVRKELEWLNCDGLEGIWAGTDFPENLPAGLVVGYHLAFFPDWLDFYREDKDAIERKFGCVEAAKRFYGGWGRDTLLELYRADLNRAVRLNAEYVVFHVSDVSLEEGYTYRWLHSNQEVIDSAAEVINTLLDGASWPFAFLLENQWWPGFTFLEPKETSYMLERVHYERKGILLDTGHLMNTNIKLRTQAEGAEHIRKQVEKHGSLAKEIRAVHLHRSLSGAYVDTHTGRLPKLPVEYLERYGVSYPHIQRIDRHLPWSDSAILPVLEQLQPDYVTHELSCRNRRQRRDMVQQQRNLLLMGGM